MDRDLNSQNEEQTSFGFFDIFRLIIRKGMNEEDAVNSFSLKRTKKRTALPGISFKEQKTLFLIVIKQLAGGLKKNFWSVIALAIALTVLHNCIISILWIIPHSPYSFASQSVILRFIFNFLSFFISVIIYIPFICLGRCFMEQRKAKYQDFSYKNIPSLKNLLLFLVLYSLFGCYAGQVPSWILSGIRWVVFNFDIDYFSKMYINLPLFGQQGLTGTIISFLHTILIIVFSFFIWLAIPALILSRTTSVIESMKLVRRYFGVILLAIITINLISFILVDLPNWFMWMVYNEAFLNGTEPNTYLVLFISIISLIPNALDRVLCLSLVPAVTFLTIFIHSTKNGNCHDIPE